MRPLRRLGTPTQARLLLSPKEAGDAMMGPAASPPLAVARGAGRDDLVRLLRNTWIIAALALLFVGLALQRPIPAVVGSLLLISGGAAMAWSRLRR